MKKNILAFALCLGLFLNLEVSAQNIETEKNNTHKISVENFNFGVVPKNAVRLPIMEINIQAKEDIELSEIWLRRSGLSTNEDFGRIWAEASSFRTSLRRSVLQDDSVQIKFLRPVRIKKNREENFIIYINLKSQGGGRTFQFKVENIIFEKVSKTQKINRISRNYSRNKYQKTQDISGFSEEDLTFQPLGISNKIKIGRISEIGKFRISNPSRKNVKIKSIKSKKLKKHELGIGDLNFISAYKKQKNYNYKKNNSARYYYNSRKNNNYVSRKITEDYNPGSKDVVFLNRYFSSKYDFYAEGLFIPVRNNNLSKNNLENSFKNFRLLLNNKEIDSTNNFTTQNGRLGLLFDSSFQAGKNDNFKILGRVTHQAQNGDSLDLDYNRINIIEGEPIFR